MSFSKEKLLLYEHHIYTLKKAGNDVNTESLSVNTERGLKNVVWVVRESKWLCLNTEERFYAEPNILELCLVYAIKSDL